MKVIHLDSETDFRGGQRQVLYLINGLKKKGIKNLLVCPKGSALYERAAQLCEVVPVGLKCENNIFASLKVVGLIKKYKPDIVHCHSAHALTHGALAVKMTGAPAALVASRRVIFPIRNMWKYGRADAVIAISRAVKDSLTACNLDAGKIHVVYSGVKFEDRVSSDRSVIRKLIGISDADFVVASIGALTEEKDHMTLLKAAGEVIKRLPRVQFVVAGEGPLGKRLKKYASENLPEGRIVFTGFIKDVAGLLAASDVLVSTSISEGLGTSILDALACGLPVIAVAAGGVNETVEDGKSGFMVQAGDSGSIAEKIIYLAENVQARKKMGEEGRRQASKFSVENTIAGTLGVYEKILGQRVHKGRA